MPVIYSVIDVGRGDARFGSQERILVRQEKPMMPPSACAQA
jgi:hypothetical protein